jgi:hypothetical protein
VSPGIDDAGHAVTLETAVLVETCPDCRHDLEAATGLRLMIGPMPRLFGTRICGACAIGHAEAGAFTGYALADPLRIVCAHIAAALASPPKENP